MGKLHELLAVEPDLKQAAKDVTSKIVQQFGQPQRFLGHSKIYQPLVEDGETFPDDHQPMASTVSDEFEKFRSDFGAWVDAVVQKETANSHAGETLEINGKDFNLPATAWLNLEDRLKTIRDVIHDIPTNDVAVEWHWDEQNEMYHAVPVTTYKTEKVVDAIVGYPATEDHPAQLQWVPKDVRVGEWTKVIYSGMFSAQKKRELLKRVESLLRDVRMARIRANQVEVENVQVAQAIFSHIFD